MLDAEAKAGDPFPRYTIRRSQRAKYLRILITPRGTVEVVLPRRATLLHAIEFVQSKQEWIVSQLKRIEKHRPLPNNALTHLERFPETLELTALHEIWHIQYHFTSAKDVKLKADAAHKVITLTGQTHQAQLCQHALTTWLKNKAKKFLTLKINELALKHALPFSALSIRNQKTRWGSCSEDKAITLNFKTIFFPENLLDHVILHELCHTVHLDHSLNFWKLLTQHDPHTTRLRKELKIADRYVPSWLYT